MASLNVSTEHTNLPRSYPHMRVTGYEPPRSYHHMLSTIHEPTRSWHSISRSKQSIIVRKQHTKKAKNNSISAWLGPHAARRNCSRPPGGTHSPPGASVLPMLVFSRHRLAKLDVPPGAPQYSALPC
ncbi:hypothetical protein DEO72_LG2g3817 [Vigna unguiculata]|uniref:Uncharacterized protein n=1 Tax=Vigna unguiculata TaxID=3917 RepID=A0A4D6L4N1_VIGUN|nr:hypothetical protein DEO72_LG2g3815 [Vigna unguiculata]QCD83472.1 hypothetical protein DEO72_LG2g3816 [Vigna unguiculata]QCD83473.1 hypothetical protein DEO72_LG2g3817 [Vigna unguiculata]